ncbi:MAG: glycine cleavage system aminomethyltransferase GcvT [Fimbriiglobus sp.]
MADARTALYDWHVARKARMVPFGGWEMPVQYAGIVEEHKAVRSAAGLFDIGHMARVSFGGQDATAFLERVFSNSVAGMKLDQVRYGLICNESGGILDDVLVYRWPYGYSMVVNASNRAKILAWFEQQRAGFDVEISDMTEDTAMLAIQGPEAVAMCAGMFDFDASTLKYYYAKPTLYCRTAAVVSRTGYTGEDGLEIIVPNHLAVSLAEELVAKGAKPCGLGARDTLRLEAAMPLYGHEMTEAIDPLSAGLGWAVKLDKDFIGRDALKAKSITHTRVGLELEGKRAAREGSAVLATDGTTLGTVSSGSYAPWVEKSIAMALLPKTHSAIGTKLEVDIRGSRTPAHIVPLPFYKRISSGDSP